jgi:hypothetical protein
LIARCSVREVMARDRSGSDYGDVVIGGLMAEASVETVAVGTAVTATAFVVVATMTDSAPWHTRRAITVMAGTMTGSYGSAA